MIGPVSDRRPEPRITTALVVKSALALFWIRLGSLNALEMTELSKSWKTWLGQSLCSADSMGRICEHMDAGTLREGIHHIYDRLKRNKALPDTLAYAAFGLQAGCVSRASLSLCWTAMRPAPAISAVAWAV